MLNVCITDLIRNLIVTNLHYNLIHLLYYFVSVDYVFLAEAEVGGDI